MKAAILADDSLCERAVEVENWEEFFLTKINFKTTVRN